MGKWDALDKRTDLDEYTKKHVKMTDDLYLNALSAITSIDISFPSVTDFRKHIEQMNKTYPSVVTFLNDKFWNQIVPETTDGNDKILERMKELLNQGMDPDDLGFPEFEGQSLLEVMLIIFGHYYKEKLMDRFIEDGIDTSEEQTDPAKKTISHAIRCKTK